MIHVGTLTLINGLVRFDDRGLPFYLQNHRQATGIWVDYNIMMTCAT